MSAATVAAIAKAAVAILSNEEARKKVGWVIVAILSPLIVLVVLLCAILSGTSQHNVSAVELCFHGGSISASATPEYRRYIEDMRNSFAQLDEVIVEINSQCEDGESLDDTRIKAIFYALYFAAEQPDTDGIHAFADCFVDYEERTRTVTTTDEEGNEVETTETYMVAIPVEDLAEIYERISDAMGVEITADHQANADSIYNLIPTAVPAEETAAGSLGLMSHSLGWMASALPSEQAGSPWSPRNSGTATTPSPAKRGDTLEWIWQYPQALLSGPHCLGRSQFPNITAAMVTM